MKLSRLLPLCTVTLYNVAYATQIRSDRGVARDPLSLVTGSEEMSEQKEQLANRLDAIADRVDAMLKNDGAPVKLRHEEQRLLHQAEMAVHGGGGQQPHIPKRRFTFERTPHTAAKHRRHSSVADRLRKLQAREQSPRPSGEAKPQEQMQRGSLASEVKQAERFIEAGLAADKVPQTVRDKEARLLDGAASIAQKLDLHADDVAGMEANMTKIVQALNTTAVATDHLNSSEADAVKSTAVTSLSVSNQSSTLTSAKEDSNETAQDSFFDLRKEHQLLLSRNKELRSENDKLKQYAVQAAEKLQEENHELEDSNIKLERENARLQGELTTQG